MMGDYLMFSQARRMRHDTFDLQSSESRPYRIRLGIPAGAPPADGWPLILMLGSDAFDATCALIRYHADCRPPGYLTAGVLASIDYPDDNRRRLDYTPAIGMAHTAQASAGLAGGTADAACPPDADQGGADRFLAFVLDTMLPALQQRLPLDTRRRALAGHSLGGLFTLHALLSRPDAFQTYIASSPSVWWGDRYLQRSARLLADSAERRAAWRTSRSATAPISVCISVGEFEQAVSPLERRQGRPDLERLAHTRQIRAMVDGNRDVAQALATIPELDVSFHVYPGQYHRSVWPSALNLGLLAALRNA